MSTNVLQKIPTERLVIMANSNLQGHQSPPVVTKNYFADQFIRPMFAPPSVLSERLEEFVKRKESSTSLNSAGDAFLPLQSVNSFSRKHVHLKIPQIKIVDAKQTGPVILPKLNVPQNLEPEKPDCEP